MLKVGRKHMRWSRDFRLFVLQGDRRRSFREGHVQGQIGRGEGFCTVPELHSQAPSGSDAGGDPTAGGRGAADGLSLAATQRRSLRKANTKPLSELERACLHMLWRRNIREPIEVALKRAQFPLTAPNLALVLTHVRSARDALRIYLCFIRENPSFAPDKALLDALARFWKHEAERFPAFIAILNDLRGRTFLMTPRKLTSLLRGYGWAGLVDDVLEYLSRCEESYGFKPDFFHYSCALHTCVAERRLDIALQIFEQMKENDSAPAYDTFHALINGSLSMKQPVEASLLFEQMFASKLVKCSELPCRVVSYVTIVDEMLYSPNMKNATEFLRRMINMGFVPDYFTCAKVLNAHSIRGLLKEKHEVFVELSVKGVLPDIERTRKFIKDQNTGKLTLETQTLLDSFLAALVTASNSDAATGKQATSEVVSIQVDTTSPSREGASSPQGTEESLKSSNPNTVLPSNGDLEKIDILIFDRIIYGLCVQTKSEDAFELMLRLVDNPNRTIVPSAVTSAILFDGLCWDLAWEAAERCLRLMMAWGHMPELKVYNTWVVGSAKAHLLENVQNFLNDFPDRNLLLDVTTYNILIEKFCMAGMLDEAVKLTQEVNEYNKIPDVVSYSKMIQSFAKAGNFDVPRKLLAEMVEKEITPYALPFTPLVQRLCLSGKIAEGLDLVEEIEAKGCAPLSSLYTIIVSALCKANRLQDAFNVMDIMKAKNVTPEVQTHKDLFGSCMGTRAVKPVIQAQAQ